MSKNTNLSFLTDYITADITNGRIGINNASPTVAFDVSGATKISGALTLTSTISNGTYAYTLPSATGTLALTSAISGTTNYVPKFTASGTIGNSSLQDDGTNVSLSNGYYISTRTDNTSVLRTHLLMQRGSGAGTYADIFTAGDTTNGVASIHFGFNSSSKMVITAAGNVGIGVTSLVSPGGSRNLLQISNGTNGGQIALGSSTTESNNARIFSGQYDLGFAAGVTTGNVIFYTNDTERMRITSGGNVLINKTTASGYPLEVEVFSDGNLAYFTRQGANTKMFMGGTTAGATAFYIQSNTTNGVYLTAGGTSWTANSDIRLKNIISPIDSAVDKLTTLNPVIFSWKSDDTNKENIGLIAQDVANVFPQAIDTNEDGFLGVRYVELVPVLVKAIQEQQVQIEELSAKVTLLENK